MKQISVREFSKIKDESQNILLDVRSYGEWDIANIEGTLIPLDELGERKGELDKTKTIYCLCHHGIRSQHAQQLLLSCGFENVVNISGGIDAWSTDVDPDIPSY